MNNFKMLAFEGMQGVGKTTQVNLIKDYLEKTYKSHNFKIFRQDPEDKSSVLSLNSDISQFLEVPENIAILDGTIASVVILSDVTRNHYGTTIQELDTEVKSYLNLIHKYRTVNCLLVSDNIEFLEKRTGFNSIYLETYLKGFHYFEQSQIASNLNYLRINLLSTDKIITVFDKIKKSLNI